MNFKLILPQIMILLFTKIILADELTSFTVYRILPRSFISYQKEIFRTFFFWLTDTTLLMNIAVIIADIVFILTIIKLILWVSEQQ